MNTKLQFRVLYRQFLFRLMDVELLSASARGDASKLFGRFASFLAPVSLNFAGAAVVYGGTRGQSEEWFFEHLMVAVTMLAVGIFAVFSWDLTFPDQRDVFVLVPLPVRGRILFAAKIAASASALGLTVVVLNILSGFAWPVVLAPPGPGIIGTLRMIAAFWISLLAAGTFLYCAILGVQAIVAQLPRRWYLRVSSFLQIAAFGLLLSVFCLQPWFATAKSLGAAESRGTLAWLPSYWFLGLLNELSGASSGQERAVMAPLAHRAVWGLATAIVVAGGAYFLFWSRSLRKIAEEPDALPGPRGGVWLPRFGNQPQTALAHFIVRTLGRSGQHRMILAFYSGIGFAMTTVIMEAAVAEKRRIGIDVLREVMNTPMLASSLLMLTFAVLGIRLTFSRPLNLRANWLFRVTPMPEGAICRAAIRRAMLVLSVLPICMVCAALFVWFWPWAAVAKHLFLLGLLGGILVELSVMGFQKIPFTCSYLPGKTNIHVMLWACIFLLPLALTVCAEFEQWVSAGRWIYWLAVVVLAGGMLAIRRHTDRSADEYGSELLFEEYESDELIGLGLEGPV